MVGIEPVATLIERATWCRVRLKSGRSVSTFRSACTAGTVVKLTNQELTCWQWNIIPQWTDAMLRDEAVYEPGVHRRLPDYVAQQFTLPHVSDPDQTDRLVPQMADKSGVRCTAAIASPAELGWAW